METQVQHTGEQPTINYHVDVIKPRPMSLAVEGITAFTKDFDFAHTVDIMSNLFKEEFVEIWFQSYWGSLKRGKKKNSTDVNDYNWFFISDADSTLIGNIDVEKKYLFWMRHEYNS